jgi:hypothetical protein
MGAALIREYEWQTSRSSDSPRRQFIPVDLSTGKLALIQP